MGRELDVHSGGVAVGVERDTREDANNITARASGYANLRDMQQGRYHDLASDGGSISPETDTMDLASVPPGSSFNPDHYADVPAESRAESELPTAVMTLEGRMENAVKCDFEWTDPSGRTMWTGVTEIDDPGDHGYDYWEYLSFYTWVGRDFSQTAATEIVTTGTHTATFDTDYGTWSADFNITGPRISGCSIPDETPADGTAEVQASVTNAAGSNRAGDVVWVRDGDRRDELARSSFTVGAFGTQTVTAEIDASAIGGASGDTETIAVYCLL